MYRCMVCVLMYGVWLCVVGDLHKIMMRCIELAECVVVFINKAYEDRISGDHVDDDCLL